MTLKDLATILTDYARSQLTSCLVLQHPRIDYGMGMQPDSYFAEIRRVDLATLHNNNAATWCAVLNFYPDYFELVMESKLTYPKSNTAYRFEYADPASLDQLDQRLQELIQQQRARDEVLRASTTCPG